MKQIVTVKNDKTTSRMIKQLFIHISLKVEPPTEFAGRVVYTEMLNSIRLAMPLFKKLSLYTKQISHLSKSGKYSRGILMGISGNVNSVLSNSYKSISLKEAKLIAFYHCIALMLEEVNNMDASQQEKDAKGLAILVTYFAPFNDHFD